MSLEPDVDRIAAESDFAGIVRVDRGGTTELSAAYGLADRIVGADSVAQMVRPRSKAIN